MKAQIELESFEMRQKLLSKFGPEKGKCISEGVDDDLHVDIVIVQSDWRRMA